MLNYSNSELVDVIRQARTDEDVLADAYLAGNVPESDVLVAMGSVNILVDEAIKRGLIRGPLDYI